MSLLSLTAVGTASLDAAIASAHLLDIPQLKASVAFSLLSMFAHSVIGRESAMLCLAVNAVEA